MTKTDNKTSRAPTDAVARLLQVVETMRQETRLQRATPATLDSHLERDLEFDSLARVELFHRVENAFAARLAQDTIVSAETPRDLLRAIESAGAARVVVAPTEIEISPVVAVEGLPDKARTLVDVLDWHVQAHADRTHIIFYRDAEHTDPLSYAGLRDGARAIAAGLNAKGLERGQAVGIMLPTSLEFFYSFFGVLLAGCIPVPLYPPVRPSLLEEHLRRQSGILNNCQARLLITVDAAKLFAQLLRAQVQSLDDIVRVEDLRIEGAAVPRAILKPDDTALLQYTSGSTGNPKGVVLSHANLLANIRAWGSAVSLTSSDVAISWLPLYHDMGLIGAWMGSLYHACLLVLMSPLDFLARPERWLRAIHRHRGTVTAAPNFAFELCARRVRDKSIEGLDLSSWRFVANGAEPVSADTIERFCERFAHYGFRPETMAPMYGLAECSVGLAVPPLGRPPLIDRIQREAFRRDGLAVPAVPDDPHAIRFVACGQPLPGHQIRVVDETGFEVAERHVGRLEFSGPSATRGYFRNPEETKKLIHGEWLDSGDVAYIAAGDVYITSRVKDVIIRGGHNIYPYELEEAVGNLAGIRKGSVAVFGTLDRAAGTERLVVVAETREHEKEKLEKLREQVNALSLDLLGTPADEIVLAPPHSVLKTSSGKIRRGAIRERYEQGTLGKRPPSVSMQLLHVARSGVSVELARLLRILRQVLYAGYLWFTFALVTPMWLVVLLAPRRDLARQLARTAARLFLKLSRLPVTVEGLDRLPAQTPCVGVANHASYLDAVILFATLPMPFKFVAKREFERQFIPRLFFKRIGTEFVERFDFHTGVEDVRRLVDCARQGDSLFFFPEGTFTRAPGLAPFHMGAFTVAAEVNSRVVPVALRGTRSVLRGNGYFPRYGAVHITVGEPIIPEGSDWAATVKLRDAARAFILRACGEPDLTR